MKCRAATRLAILSLIIILSAFLLVSASLPPRVSAALRDNGNRQARRAQLEARLGSARADEFHAALAELAEMDEPGAYATWRTALQHPDARLQKAAWRAFQGVQSKLARNEFVPQVVRVRATPDTIAQVAGLYGLEFHIWSAAPSETVIAAPPYLVERLARQGLSAEVLFDSVADWQQARKQGDPAARAVTPAYQSDEAERATQVRVAVIDLSKSAAPATGNAAWLGDRENLLMRRGALIAYLDVFSTDGSRQAIDAHVEAQYTGRGFQLAGFYTTEEFSMLAPRLFGEAFSFGPRNPNDKTANMRTQAAGDHYHTYEQTQNEFKALAAAHPDLAAYVRIGQSYEGREIFALKITRDAAADNTSKPDVLITGCHHAREWISVESPVYFANQLINQYASDSGVRQAVDHLQIWIVPIVNPDGLVYSQSGSATISDGTRMWRKNRRPITLSPCASTVGVDLNRNYDYQWRLRGDTPCGDYCSADKSCLQDDVGASDDPANVEIYRGPQATSEPEIKAMQALIRDPNRHFRAELDYHNFAQLILYPWGYQHDAAPDGALQAQLAQQVSAEIKKTSGRLYQPEASVDLYQVTGSSTDFAYGASRVAVPLTIEMRPTCCDFAVPEEQIGETNAENWAGLRPILNWAAGPPILESIKAYSIGSDGGFSKLVYAAHWVQPADGTAGARQLVTDTRFPGIAPGPLQVRLQFSKGMRTALPPRSTLGRDGKRDELTLIATTPGEGWQKTAYDNDTWTGETVITQDENLTSPWRLYVDATDMAGFNLDAEPATVAAYATGTGAWAAYEEAGGAGTEGGTDAIHQMAPTLAGDIPNLVIASPGGGERLVAGEPFAVTWTLPRQAGFQPVKQQLYFSTDGGISFTQLVEDIAGNLEKYSLTIPKVATTTARLRLVAIEGSFGNAIYGDSRADFTIGANVGANVAISLVASEKQDIDWMDNSAGQATSGALRLVMNLRITNRGSVAIASPFLRIADLNRSHVLLTRDPQTPPGEGARQVVDVGEDKQLAPGESADVRLILGLVSKKKFAMSVELYGVGVGSAVGPAAATSVWIGKPRNQ
ncbi:MAG TPA: M14 family metallopeptidase [Blastocatellia bacterium]|nr:M14 family metallopeptidase [Blastocatellia bacterium]